jgi:Na+/H+ antiporter NhaC
MAGAKGEAKGQAAQPDLTARPIIFLLFIVILVFSINTVNTYSSLAFHMLVDSSVMR